MTDEPENIDMAFEAREAEIIEPETSDAEITDAQIAEAEIVEPEIVAAEADDSESQFVVPPPIAGTIPPLSSTDAAELPASDEFPVHLSVQRSSAKGGAVGSVLLGSLGLIGMPLSSYSFVNVLLAFLFSLWGLNSELKKVAIVGAILALAGLISFCALQMLD